MNILDKNKVIVGLSGGVDSAVAAHLLKREGREVIGACLVMRQSREEIEDARAVAEALGIKFHKIDMRKAFESLVIDDFAAEYMGGRTPNPCLRCNRFIKWDGLLSLADELGAYYVACGHYARIAAYSDGSLCVGRSAGAKDQSYALYALTQEQLRRTLLPLGDKSKEEIRALAANLSLPVARKKDSQDICFVPDGDYASFLTRICVTEDKPGNFVGTDGRIFGRHKGISHYTVGQRRGLGIAAAESLYVLAIRPETNEVVLGFEDETYCTELVCNNLNIPVRELPENFSVFCKIRYNHCGECAIISKLSDDEIICKFVNPVRGAAPGQAAVFYKDDLIIAGGTIKQQGELSKWS